MDQLGLRVIAVFYQHDAYGYDGLRGAEPALKKFGLVPVSTGSYVRGTLDVEEGLDRIWATGARSVVMMGTYEPCAKFILLIALFTRWILISSLTSELKRRGIGIGYSIAESSRSLILTENIPQLTSLLFDTRIGERTFLVVYVHIQDEADQVLAHTFSLLFPVAD